MKTNSFCTAAFALAALFAAGAAVADKPEWADGGKHGGKKDDRHEERAEKGRRGDADFRFGDSHRHIVEDYYGPQFRSGKCPPGLAKKHNGCMPPGQAKKWAMGRPLPADLRYYDLPRDLLLRLPAPPRDHRYVRVASDILLIAVGSSMVVDAIEDIGR